MPRLPTTASTRMSAYKEGATTIVGFDYNSAGRRSALRFGAGATSSAGYGYDGAGRLQSLDRQLAGTGWDQTLGFTYNPGVARSSHGPAANNSYASTSARNVGRSYAVNELNQYTGTVSDGAASGDLRLRRQRQPHFRRHEQLRLQFGEPPGLRLGR